VKAPKSALNWWLRRHFAKIVPKKVNLAQSGG